MKLENFTVHASVRGYDRHVEIVQTVLAHVIGDKAEQAYRRSDALEKRRGLMEAWSAFCGGAPQEGIVVPLAGRAK